MYVQQSPRRMHGFTGYKVEEDMAVSIPHMARRSMLLHVAQRCPKGDIQWGMLALRIEVCTIIKTRGSGVGRRPRPAVRDRDSSEECV